MSAGPRSPRMRDELTVKRILCCLSQLLGVVKAYVNLNLLWCSPIQWKPKKRSFNFKSAIKRNKKK